MTGHENGDWLSKIFKQGVPAGIAIYLVYLLGTAITVDIRNGSAGLQQHIEDTGSLRLAITEMQLNSRAQLAVATQMCVNAATTAEERSHCFEASRGIFPDNR